FDLSFLDVIADFEIAVAGIDNGYVIDHTRVLHFAVRRLYKAVVVDAGKAAQRRDQSDVRTFRRLNRADTSVVRRLNAADFESSGLTRPPTRPKGRETSLVRNFRQGIRLIHEL